MAAALVGAHSQQHAIARARGVDRCAAPVGTTMRKGIQHPVDDRQVHGACGAHDGAGDSAAERSGVRLVDHLKGPAWLTCLKVDAGGTAQHYAVFIQGDKVIDWRGGIVIDQCHKETYTPLATATVAKKPGP